MDDQAAAQTDIAADPTAADVSVAHANSQDRAAGPSMADAGPQEHAARLNEPRNPKRSVLNTSSCRALPTSTAHSRDGKACRGFTARMRSEETKDQGVSSGPSIQRPNASQQHAPANCSTGSSTVPGMASVPLAQPGAAQLGSTGLPQQASLPLPQTGMSWIVCAFNRPLIIIIQSGSHPHLSSSVSGRIVLHLDL